MNTSWLITIAVIAFMVFLSIVVIGFMLSNRVTIDKLNRRLNEAVYEESHQIKVEIASEGIYKHEMKDVYFDKGKLVLLQKEYDEMYGGYVLSSQFISLFPLLGILGTVAGLVFGTNTSDVQSLLAGLGAAMYTTLAGLICSIRKLPSNR